MHKQLTANSLMEQARNLLLQLRQVHLHHEIIQKQASSCFTVFPFLLSHSFRNTLGKTRSNPLQECERRLEQDAHMERVWTNQQPVLGRVRSGRELCSGLGEARDQSWNGRTEDLGNAVFMGAECAGYGFWVGICKTECPLVDG
jgi:hypothetical protein